MMTRRATSPKTSPHLRLIGGAATVGIPVGVVAPVASTSSVAISLPETTEEPVSALRLASATARLQEGDALSSEMVRLVELYGRIDESSARDMVRSLVALIATTGENPDSTGASIH
jgi:hypothetical protein